MRIAVTGASGFVGRAVVERLRSAGHEITSLYVRKLGAVDPVEAVVHLAGEPVAQRWTARARQRIRASRVDGTLKLVNSLANLEPRPSVLVSASAIGYYGSRGEEILTESSPPGSDFLASVCVEWERTAARAALLGLRVVTLRTGMVLGRGGGALARILPIFRLGLGGPLASGRHWMSWIHRDDLVSLIEFVLASNLGGAVNATSPNPVRNAEFTAELASAVHRPAFLPVPAFALRLAYGEMATVLLSSQRVLPAAAQAAGFQFRYPELGPALLEALQ